MVGDSITLADFALLPYNVSYAPRLLPEGVKIEDRYPAVAAWQNRLLQRKSVADHIKLREAYMKEYAHAIPAFKGERSRMEPVFPEIPVGA
jgi:glutathione S-transferase